MEARTTILLVDDEPGIRTVLSLFISDIGYSVTTADSGEAALAAFREHPADIVVADIKMAGMDGIALLRAIKAESADTEVIMMTGHGDFKIAIESLKLEAADFITKPINSDVLEIALKRTSEKIALRRALRRHTENLEKLVAETSARLVESERRAAVGQVVEGLFSAMAALSNNREAAFAAFDEVPCFISLHDKAFNIVSINRHFREHIGDRTGVKSWQIYRTGRRNRDNCPVAEAFRTGMGSRSVEIVATKTGDLTVSVHTAPIRSRDGAVDEVLEIATDLIDVRNLQVDLQQTRQRYRHLFDEVPCYISVQDRALRLVDINRRFKEDFGDRPAAQCYAVYKGRDAPCPDCPVLKTFEDGVSHQTEMVVSTNTGQQRNVLIWTAPIRDEAGEIVQVMEMSTDVTRMHELQGHLVSLGLMIGSVSHGVKGLLTGMDGGLYMLNSGIESESIDDIREGRDIIRTTAERIKTAVLDILYYAKERALDWQAIGVQAFAEDAAMTINSRLKGTNITFHTEYGEELGDMDMDVEAVRSALINILNNAVDACLADIRKDRHAIVFSTFADDVDDEVVFDITDNGTGMSKATMDNLFTLFFSTKGKKGTGLGLFITEKIVKQHGGHIAVTSTPGQGSHFRITLPRRRAREAEGD
ncbi:MAG: response regulator [Pseudomonadota bacterium]